VVGADVLEAAAVVAVHDAAVYGGYAVDLDALDSAARAFQQTSDSLGALSLPSTGVATGATTGTTTGANVHSALASVIADALGTAATSLADVGGRLRSMAHNYRQAEALLTQMIESVGASRADDSGPAALIPPGRLPGARPATENGGAPGAVGLAHGWEAAGVAMMLGASAAYDAYDTPDAHPAPTAADADHLLTAASDWFAVAATIDDHQHAAAAAADVVCEHCAGPAVEAFREAAAGLFATRPSGSETVAAGAPLMDQVAACCRLLGRVHDAAAAAATAPR
jgi:hypothetical protein